MSPYNAIPDLTLPVFATLSQSFPHMIIPYLILPLLFSYRLRMWPSCLTSRSNDLEVRL